MCVWQTSRRRDCCSDLAPNKNGRGGFEILEETEVPPLLQYLAVLKNFNNCCHTFPVQSSPVTLSFIRRKEETDRYKKLPQAEKNSLSSAKPGWGQENARSVEMTMFPLTYENSGSTVVCDPDPIQRIRDRGQGEGQPRSRRTDDSHRLKLGGSFFLVGSRVPTATSNSQYHETSYVCASNSEWQINCQGLGNPPYLDAFRTVIVYVQSVARDSACSARG